MQFLVEPARAKPFGIRGELVAGAARLQRGARRFCGKHARLDGAMASLDARGVEKAGVVADERASRENELRQRLQPSCGDRARAVADAFSAVEKTADRRMGLEALELLVGREIGIGIAQPDDESHGDLVRLHVIEERPTIRLAVERPARGMHHQPGLVLFGLHLPELLQADAVHLRISALAQAVSRFQVLAEVAAAAFGKERVFAVQLHPGLVGIGLLAFAVDAEIAGGDPLDHIAVVEHFCGGEAGKDFHAQRFGLAREPTAYVAQAHHIIAMVLKARRQQPCRRFHVRAFAEEKEAIARHRRVERRAFRFPLGQHLA